MTAENRDKKVSTNGTTNLQTYKYDSESVMTPEPEQFKWFVDNMIELQEGEDFHGFNARREQIIDFYATCYTALQRVTQERDELKQQLLEQLIATKDLLIERARWIIGGLERSGLATEAAKILIQWLRDADEVTRENKEGE